MGRSSEIFLYECTAMNTPIHLDIAVSNLARLLENSTGVLQALLIEDSVGRVSVGIWSSARDAVSDVALAEAGGVFFSGTVFHASEHPRGSLVDLEEAWDEASLVLEDGHELSKVRRIVRFRTLTSWQYQQDPVWPLSSESPAIVTFYSYKGGLGRTTALVSFAIQRARLGDRVAILDLDLEAPGLDLLERYCEPTPRYGVVDYLLEAHQLEFTPDLQDYCGTVSHPDLVRAGGISVFPAGHQDGDYLGKVSRIDLEWEYAQKAGIKHPLEKLLVQIRDEFKPTWILIDSRTGFSEVSGLLLSGFAHLHVLFGVQSQQSWNGLERVIRRFGSRLETDKVKAASLLIAHSMVLSDSTFHAFASRSDSVCQDCLYPEDPEEDGLEPYDTESENAPHIPVKLTFQQQLSQEANLEDQTVLDVLLSGGYNLLAKRILLSTGYEESNGEN